MNKKIYEVTKLMKEKDYTVKLLQHEGEMQQRELQKKRTNKEEDFRQAKLEAKKYETLMQEHQQLLIDKGNT